MDPIDLRLKNAARDGTKSSFGPTYGTIGLKATLEAAKAHPHYKAPLDKDQGRGVACGFWFNFGGNTSVNLTVNADGTVGVTTGSPDIGGSPRLDVPDGGGGARHPLRSGAARSSPTPRRSATATSPTAAA